MSRLFFVVGLSTMIASSHLAPLVPTKLSVPQLRPFWVRRERLIARLASSAHARLTVVVAPPGFGKSTLVAQWIAGIEQAKQGTDHASRSMLHALCKAAWLRLDEHDQDALHFLTYVAGAVARVYPHALTHTLPLLRSQEPPQLYLVLQALLVDLDALPGGLTLILDDYHNVMAQEIHQAVAYLLRHLPPACHLVILSRVDPPLALAQLRSEQQCAELRASDLRFTLDETKSMLAKLLGRAPAAALVANLQQKTEGWAIAIQLAALAQPETGTLDLDVGIARRRIAEYLTEEVFNRQPAPIQEALLALAVPERFCAGLYAALLGTPDDLASAEKCIGQLVHANLLLIPLDGEGHWYRFHHLFRDLLLRRLRLQMVPMAIASLEQRAARWLEAEGQTLVDAQGHATPAVRLLQGHRGRPTWEARSLPAAPAPRLPELLTRREREILALLAERWSDKEIAARLVITSNTVRKHTSTIFGKLEVSNRREAVVAARALGLLPNAL